LNDQAMALHLELVEAFEFIVQRFKNLALLQIPQRFAVTFAHFRWLSMNEFARLRLNGYFHLHPAR